MVARWTTTCRPWNWTSATKKIRALVSCSPPASSRSIKRRTNSKSKTIKTPGNFKTLWTGAKSNEGEPQRGTYEICNRGHTDLQPRLPHFRQGSRLAARKEQRGGLDHLLPAATRRMEELQRA